MSDHRESWAYRSQPCRRSGGLWGLPLHRPETFKLSTDLYFVDKVHDADGDGRPNASAESVHIR
jgi:hypothetical protein